MQNKDNRRCEICEKEIPEDYGNALCDDCYAKEVADKDRKVAEEVEERKKEGRPEAEDVHKINAQEHIPVNGITEPNYKENPVQDEIDLIQRNMTQFLKSGKWLWTNQRTMYEFIRDSFIDIVKSHPQYPKFVWKPTVCDVGCGTGCGSNILSQEADFVWGIDKNARSVAFANELFKRNKNNIYYTPEIRFDVIDIDNPPPNIDMKFDSIVAIEVFEHMEDFNTLLKLIKHMCHTAVVKGDREALRATDVWISTPNRLNRHISDDKPNNKYHVREHTSVEFFTILKQHFSYVQFFNSAGEKIDGDNTLHTPILALARNLI